MSWEDTRMVGVKQDICRGKAYLAYSYQMICANALI